MTQLQDDHDLTGNFRSSWCLLVVNKGYSTGSSDKRRESVESAIVFFLGEDPNS